MLNHKRTAAGIFSILTFLSCSTMSDADKDAKAFESLRSKAWKEVFSDTFAGRWRDKWFLDGDKAKVTNNDDSMTIDTAKGFAVLWTKQRFAGDLRIEYDFKRVDKNNEGVNIIYIQATGDGQNGHVKDISLWADRRTEAAMSDYFNNMHTYHISYATFGNDYIRARRYLPLAGKELAGTQLSGEYTKTGLFADQKWIHVTVIKQARQLWMELKHPNKTLLCHFINDDKPPVEEGRIGLRLMPKRKSQFKNIQILTSGSGKNRIDKH